MYEILLKLVLNNHFIYHINIKRLNQKCVVRITLDIYVFINITRSIPLLMDYYSTRVILAHYTSA